MYSNKLLRVIISIFCIVLLTGLVDTSNENQKVISIHYLTLKDGISPQKARMYLETEWFKIFEETPGINAALGKPDRGGAKGDFVVIYTFDSKWTRDLYYPKDGEYGEPMRKIVEKYSTIVNKHFETYFVQEEYSYDDYLLFSWAK